MNLFRIKEKALREKKDIRGVVDEIMQAIQRRPNGADIVVHPFLIDEVETYCDDNYIPFHHVTEDCCSVAASYTQLHYHERAR